IFPPLELPPKATNPPSIPLSFKSCYGCPAHNALTDFMPDFINTAVGTMFLLGQSTNHLDFSKMTTSNMDEEEGGGNQTLSTKATHVVAKISELEKQMVDGKLVLVNEHGKPLEMKVTNEASSSKPIISMGDQLVKSDGDEVELLNDETSRYMSLTGGRGFYEDDLDFYGGYEAQVFDLPEQMQTFYDQFDIRFRSCVRE
nr:hypothetical protein [Tanacetum cinerariifolium]